MIAGALASRSATSARASFFEKWMGGFVGLKPHAPFVWCGGHDFGAPSGSG